LTCFYKNCGIGPHILGKNKKNLHRSLWKKFCLSCLHNYGTCLYSSRRKVSNANTIVDLIGTENPILKLIFFISVVIKTVLIEKLIKKNLDSSQQNYFQDNSFLVHTYLFFTLDFPDAGRDGQSGVCELSFACFCVCRWIEITKYTLFSTSV